MKVKNILLSILYFSSSAIAVENIEAEASAQASVEIKITQEEVNDSAAHNFPVMSELAGSKLEKQRNDYLSKKNRSLGNDVKGNYVGWGESAISVSPNSIDFAQKRIMAFEKAFVDAKADFVRMKKQKVATTITRDLFQDDRDHNEVEIKDGSIIGLAKKLRALAEAAIDEKLVEYGVDPSTIENSDINKKRQLMENSINKEVTVKAVQNISGIRIIATFEDVSGVGVLIKASPKYRAMARAIASKKLVGYPSKGDPKNSIKNQLNDRLNDKDYFVQHGLRIMTDDSGNRVLVSFGQWAPKITKHDSRMKINTAIKAAKGIAYDQALSYITMFVNTTLALENKTKLSDSETINALSRTDGTNEEQESSSVGAMLEKFVKETSRVTIEGVSQVHSWAINHPETGHPLVGTVLMWSPTTQEYARAYDKKRPINKKDNKKKQNKGSSQKNYKMYKSMDFGDDF
jgi:hypothetical protein